MVLLPSEREALDELRDRVVARFGDRVCQLVLFGSRARAEGHEDSDLDVLVVIDELEGREAREIDTIVGELLFSYDVLVSTLVVSSEHYARLKQRERLIAREIERDGVPL